MDEVIIDQAIALLEMANANLEPELLEASAARRLLSAYARVEKLGAFGVAAIDVRANSSQQSLDRTGSAELRVQQTDHRWTTDESPR